MIIHGWRQARWGRSIVGRSVHLPSGRLVCDGWVAELRGVSMYVGLKLRQISVASRLELADACAARPRPWRARDRVVAAQKDYDHEQND